MVRGDGGGRRRRRCERDQVYEAPAGECQACGSYLQPGANLFSEPRQVLLSRCVFALFVASLTIYQCRYFNAAENLLEKATLARLESRDVSNKKAEAYTLLFRFVEWLEVLKKHKDYALPTYAQAKRDMKENLKFVTLMLEELHGQLRADHISSLRAQREAAAERKRLQAVKPASEPSIEEQAADKRGVDCSAASYPQPAPAPELSALRDLVGGTTAGGVAASTKLGQPSVSHSPTSMYAAIGNPGKTPSIPLHKPHSTQPSCDLPPAYDELSPQREASPRPSVQASPGQLDTPPSYDQVSATQATSIPVAPAPAVPPPLPQPDKEPRPEPQSQQKFMVMQPVHRRQNSDVPCCDCGNAAKIKEWKKKDSNHGRKYFTCAKYNDGGCKYHEWVAETRPQGPSHCHPAPTPPITNPVRLPQHHPIPAPNAVMQAPAGAQAPARAPAVPSPQPTEPRPVRCKRPSQASGLVGLKNLGNTCYLNSCVQCLSHTYELSQQCRNLQRDDLNPSSASKGLLATEFARLVMKLWTQPKYSVTEPSALKKQLGKLNESFAGFGQQDSQELLRFLLDGLHEDLNRVRKKPAW